MEKKQSGLQGGTFFGGVVSFVQILTYLLTALPLRTYYQARRTFPHNMTALRRGSLLVANHQSLADPFEVVMNLPFLKYVELLPIWFPADHDWMSMPVIGKLLELLGCYDVGKSRKEKMLALLKTCRLLKKKETVFLFPEGEISKSEIKDFQRGIEFFIKEAENVMFVRMEGFHQSSILRVFSTERKLIYGAVQQFQGKDLKAVDLRRLFKEVREERMNVSDKHFSS